MALTALLRSTLLLLAPVLLLRALPPPRTPHTSLTRLPQGGRPGGRAELPAAWRGQGRRPRAGDVEGWPLSPSGGFGILDKWLRQVGKHQQQWTIW